MTEEITMEKAVKEIAGVNKQPKGVTHSGNDAKQAQQHNRDMEKVEKLHQRGQK